MSERFLLTPGLKCVCAGMAQSRSQWGSSCSALPSAECAGGFPGSFHGNTQSLAQLLPAASASIKI